jgi:tRNA U34 5-carboxymethylaminomethyl modifying GTPase MnmE/TrmE
MKKFLIFKKTENGYGEKMGSYGSEFKDDSSANRSYLMAEPLASHFELPEGMDEDCVELEEVEGVSSLVEKEELVLAKRQKKAESNLNSIRNLREPLLKEADIEIFKLEDDSEDASAMRAYRKSLRECTDDLKKVNGEAKLSCENLVPSEFVFPVKP